MSTTDFYDQKLIIDPPKTNALIEAGIQWLKGMRDWQAAVLVVTYFLAVATLDLALGDEIVLLMLYLPVIAFLTVRINLKIAVNAAVACSVIWLIDDFLIATSQGPTTAELVMATTHFFSFVIFAIVVSRLKIALHREHIRARYDHLTGLANMQTFYTESRRVLSKAKFAQQPFSIVFFDCDNFKHVNDTQGHAEGNRVLEAVADELKAQTRENDCVARFGGDEFAAFLPGIVPADCQRIIERLREQLNQRMQRHGWPVTFSIGIANFSSLPNSIEDAVKVADEAMYDCKHRSKDAIVVRQAA